MYEYLAIKWVYPNESVRTSCEFARWALPAEKSGFTAKSARVRHGSALSAQRSGGLLGHEKKVESANFREFVFTAE